MAQLCSRSGAGGRGRSGCLTAEGIELPAVAGELLALPVDDLRRSAGDEALVPEHPVCAGDLPTDPLPLRVGVAVDRKLVTPDHRVEDAPRVSFELDDDAAPAGDGGRVLHRFESILLGCE